MAGEVVEDDDVAGPERRDEELLDPGLEALAVDRAVEDAGRAEPVRSQPGEEGHGAPVAAGREPLEALALLRPAAQRRHVGLDPGLIDEHQAIRLQPALERLPSRPLASHGGARLLEGEQGFFKAQSLASEEPPDGVAAHRDPFRRQQIPQPVDRQVRRLADQPMNQISVRLQSPGAAAAQRARLRKIGNLLCNRLFEPGWTS